MNECGLLDLVCHATALGSGIIDMFPFGERGLIFFAGMIVGERIGIWGIIVAVIGWIALRYGKPVPTDEQYPHPDRVEVPKPKKSRPTIRLPNPFKRK